MPSHFLTFNAGLEGFAYAEDSFGPETIGLDNSSKVGSDTGTLSQGTYYSRQCMRIDGRDASATYNWYYGGYRLFTKGSNETWESMRVIFRAIADDPHGDGVTAENEFVVRAHYGFNDDDEAQHEANIYRFEHPNTYPPDTNWMEVTGNFTDAMNGIGQTDGYNYNKLGIHLCIEDGNLSSFENHAYIDEFDLILGGTLLEDLTTTFKYGVDESSTQRPNTLPSSPYTDKVIVR